MPMPRDGIDGRGRMRCCQASRWCAIIASVRQGLRERAMGSNARTLNGAGADARMLTGERGIERRHAR
jgi:hypothetical protein